MLQGTHALRRGYGQRGRELDSQTRRLAYDGAKVKALKTITK